MPTARELLEQADALMRRNRGADAGIPVLTDSVSETAPALPPGLSPQERASGGARSLVADPLALGEPAHGQDRIPAPETAPAEDRNRSASSPESGQEPAVKAGGQAARDVDAIATLDRMEGDAEPPLLTDAVEEAVFDLAPMPPGPAEEDHSLWLGPDTVDPALHSITGPAPDTVAVVPPVTLRAPEPKPELSAHADERDPTVTRTLRAAGSEPTPPPLGSAPPAAQEAAAATARETGGAPAANDDERWRALAEQISMQVLQRLDLFIDTGLKAQLTSHLQPIVARASAELVETINDHVGQLVRTYVAEAIEREIAQWRRDNR
jgi:hypothetical protein